MNRVPVQLHSEVGSSAMLKLATTKTTIVIEYGTSRTHGPRVPAADWSPRARARGAGGGRPRASAADNEARPTRLHKFNEGNLALPHRLSVSLSRIVVF